MDDKEQIALEARKYELLDNLTRQEGWKVLLSKLEQFRQSDIKGLLTEQDMTKIYALQGRIVAYNDVINTLTSAKNIKEKLFQDITSIIEDERLKEEFDL